MQAVRYCSAEHQKRHWRQHKPYCQLVTAGRKRPPTSFADCPDEIVAKVVCQLCPGLADGVCAASRYPAIILSPEHQTPKPAPGSTSGPELPKLFQSFADDSRACACSALVRSHAVLGKFDAQGAGGGARDFANAAAVCSKWHRACSAMSIRHLALARLHTSQPPEGHGLHDRMQRAVQTLFLSVYPKCRILSSLEGALFSFANALERLRSEAIL